LFAAQAPMSTATTTTPGMKKFSSTRPNDCGGGGGGGGRSRAELRDRRGAAPAARACWTRLPSRAAAGAAG
jgi:hypothetical protein